MDKLLGGLLIMVFSILCVVIASAITGDIMDMTATHAWLTALVLSLVSAGIGFAIQLVIVIFVGTSKSLRR